VQKSNPLAKFFIFFFFVTVSVHFLILDTNHKPYYIGVYMSTSMYERQNEKANINLVKAAILCTRRERALKFLPVVLSLSVCIMGVLNQYFEFFDSLWLAFATGVVLIADALLFALARRFQVWSASFMDIFDHRVYGIPSNKLVTKHMSQVITDQFAARIKDRKGKLRDYYFESIQETSKHCSVFENQYKQYLREYNLLYYSRKYLYVTWVCFLLALIVISAIFNDAFLQTITNIFVPSLTIIMLIVNAWISFEENIRDLRSCINNLDKKRQEYRTYNEQHNLNSPLFLRGVQDGVYKFRSLNFTVPSILAGMFNSSEKRLKKRMMKENKKPEPILSRRRRPKKTKLPKKKDPIKQLEKLVMKPYTTKKQKPTKKKK
jgi:hypothetical protein